MGLLIDLWQAFLLCGLLSFGGGYAMIPLIERELIAARGWLDLGTFTEIIAVAEMTPGPVAVNTATFVGYRVAGLAGSVASTLAVITVPALVSGVLAAIIGRYGQHAVVSTVLCGLRPAACALLTAAVVTVGRGLALDLRSAVIAFAAGLALYRRINPLLVIAGSALLGLLLF